MNLFAAGVTFDPSITLGTILQIGTMVWAGIAVYYGIKAQISKMQSTLDHHSEQFSSGDMRVTRIEAAVKQMGDHVQRLIGREEARELYTGIDRRGRDHS